MNKIVFFLVAFAAQAAMAGIFYAVDDDGAVTRHEGDVPFPAGAIWQARCPRDADPATLSVVNGVVVVDPVKVNSVQAKLEDSSILPRQEPTGIEVPWVVFLDATNRQKGIAMELTTNNVPIYYEFHASPVDWKKVDANRKAALSAAAAKEKDSADAIAYAKDKAAKDGVAKAEAVAATNGKEPSDKEKIALMWKHYLAVVGAEKK